MIDYVSTHFLIVLVLLNINKISYKQSITLEIQKIFEKNKKRYKYLLIQ